MYRYTIEDILNVLPIIYGKNIKTIEDVIKLLNPYKFEGERMELYKNQYLLSIGKFLEGGEYFIAYPYFIRIIREGKWEDDYIKLFRKKVDSFFMVKSERYYLK